MSLTERQILSDAMEYIYIRRTLGQDLSRIPFRFYEMDDAGIIRIGRNHLCKNNSDGDMLMDKRENVCGGHRDENNEGFEFQWADEGSLVRSMSPGLKNEFILQRYYGDKAECMELGARYLLHLQYPDLPLELTVKPPEDEEEGNVVGDADFTDGESDHKWDDSESDVASQMSNVTMEDSNL